MDTTPKDERVGVDPLDTLTQEQKANLRAKVAENLNAWAQSMGKTGRPEISGWSGFEIYKENISDPLFERMAWELITQNFKKITSEQSPSFVNRLYDYLGEFEVNTRYSQLFTFRRTELWLQRNRKLLVQYLLDIFPTCNSKNSDDNADGFSKLAIFALGNLYDLQDRRMDYHNWKPEIDKFNKDRYAELQRLKQAL